jgi:D-alanyl-D-alanine carboxypeptidase (penicillin-binding protein 5/6)
VVVPLVAVLVALAALEWFRPIPAPVFHPALGSSVRLPGTPPRLPWPVQGAAAMAIDGLGQIGSSGTASPLPISGLVKVMTAYLVLRDHPIANGSLGPTIAVSPATLAAQAQELATNQAVVPVASGESLSEYEALEGILVASGNDLAILLADWDAGSTAAFVARMDDTARTLGLVHTHFVDPTGASTGSLSTPNDLIRLGEAAMAISTFRAIVALPQVTLPLAGVLYNLDYNLGRAGLVGMKTGADPSSGGCYLFAASEVVAGRSILVVGAVLDQRYPDPTAAALYVGDLLASAAFRAVSPLALFGAGRPVGHITTAWGARVPVSAAGGPSVVGVPGQVVAVRMTLRHLGSSIPPHATVGTVEAEADGVRISVPLITAGRLRGPSVTWRLTRA